MSLTAIGFLLVYVSGVLAALIRSPFFGLLTYLFTFYANPYSRWWGNDLPSLRYSMIISVVTLVSIWIHRNKCLSVTEGSDGKKLSWYSPWGVKIFILYALWMWVQVAWAISPEDHYYGATLVTKYVILFYLMYEVVDTEEKLFYFVLAHILGCAYLGWVALDAGGGRLEGVGGPGIAEANALGGHLNTAVLIGGVMMLVVKDFRVKLFLLMAMPLIVNGVILTQSRGAILALIFGGIVMYYLTPKAAKMGFKLYAILAVLLFSILAHDAFLTRISTLFGSQESVGQVEEVGGGRKYIISKQWLMFKDNMLGVGHRGTKGLSPSYMDQGRLSGGARSSHNVFMAILVDQGIIGITLYISLIISVGLSILKLHKSNLTDEQQMYIAGFGGALSSLLLAGIFTNFFRSEINIWLLSCLFIAISFIKAKKISENNENTRGY